MPSGAVSFLRGYRPGTGGAGVQSVTGPFDFAVAKPITGNPRMDADIWDGIMRTGPANYQKSLGGLMAGLQHYARSGNQARANAAAIQSGTPPFSLDTGAPFSPIRNVPGLGSAQTQSPNPFTTISNVKNPGISSAVDSILNGIKGLTSDPNINTNVVKANTKSQAIASQMAGAQNRFTADVNDSRQSFAD